MGRFAKFVEDWAFMPGITLAKLCQSFKCPANGLHFRDPLS